MTTRTYSDLLDSICAITGVASYSSPEQARILALANRRFRQAYDLSHIWPRYLVTGEARLMDEEQIVPYTQDSAVKVSGAGTDDANGLYQPTGTLNNKNSYTKDGSGDYVLYFDTHWKISDGTTVLYTDGGSAHPWAGTWSVAGGASAAPTVSESARDDVSEFLRIHRTQPFLNNSAQEYDYFVQSDGAHVLNVTDTAPLAVYVTYKKEWDGPYADTDEVPQEFFNYVVQGVYADLLRSSGQADKAISEEALVTDYLALELQRAEQLRNNSSLTRRISTYVSRQSRY